MVYDKNNLFLYKLKCLLKERNDWIPLRFTHDKTKFSFYRLSNEELSFNMTVSIQIIEVWVKEEYFTYSKHNEFIHTSQSNSRSIYSIIGLQDLF